MEKDNELVKDRKDYKEGSEVVKSGKSKNAKTSQKGRYRGKRGDKGSNKESRVPRTSNPVEWYTLSPQITKDTSSFPYNTMTGRQLTGWLDIGWIREPEMPDQTTEGVVNNCPAAPGVCVLPLVTGFGWSKDAASTINVAGRSIYTFVRHKNSGHTNYEYPDLMMYILMMQEIYNEYFEACRVYRLAMTYKVTNRYMPVAILSALGYNADNIMENLAQLRASLNIFASQIGSLCVPDVFTAPLRQCMLFTNVYLDGATDRGQYYVFKRAIGRRFDPTTVGGGSLKPYSLSSGRTWSDIVSELTTNLNAVLGNEDMNIMSGDILKAYDGKIFKIGGIHEDEYVEPVFDESVLSQIENSTSFGQLAFSSINPQILLPTLEVYQSHGYVMYTPGVGYPTSADVRDAGAFRVRNPNYDTYMLNCHMDSPTPEFNLEATRLMAVLTAEHYDSTEGYHIIKGIKAGSEFVTTPEYYFYSFTPNGLRSTASVLLPSYCCVDHDNYPDRTKEFIRSMTVISNFDWHPIMKIMINDISTGKLLETLPFGDLHVYTLLDRSDVEHMHECALLAEFRTELIR